MPIYEYQCRKCERFFEKIRIFRKEKDSVKCPYCGEEGADRVVSKFSSFSKGESSSSSCGGGSTRFS